MWSTGRGASMDDPLLRHLAYPHHRPKVPAVDFSKLRLSTPQGPASGRMPSVRIASSRRTPRIRTLLTPLLKPVISHTPRCVANGASPQGSRCGGSRDAGRPGARTPTRLCTPGEQQDNVLMSPGSSYCSNGDDDDDTSLSER